MIQINGFIKKSHKLKLKDILDDYQGDKKIDIFQSAFELVKKGKTTSKVKVMINIRENDYRYIKLGFFFLKIPNSFLHFYSEPKATIHTGEIPELTDFQLEMIELKQNFYQPKKTTFLKKLLTQKICPSQTQTQKTTQERVSHSLFSL